MCPCHNIIEFLNSVSWKCDFFVTYQRRFTANVPTLLNRNLHPDCNNWTNIYPQCVKRNSCSRWWHLENSSQIVQIGQRKVREKGSNSKSHLEILLSRHISTEIQTNSYFTCDQFFTSSQRIVSSTLDLVCFSKTIVQSITV